LNYTDRCEPVAAIMEAARAAAGAGTATLLVICGAGVRVLDGEYAGIAALGEHLPQRGGDPGVAMNGRMLGQAARNLAQRQAAAAG